MKKLLVVLALVTVLALALAACGGGAAEAGEAEPTGPDPKAGEELFNSVVIGAQAGCVTCHSLTPGEVIVGPSMAGIASRAGSTVPGLTAEEYLEQSILEPNAYLVEGYAADIMVQVWEEELSDQQLDELIAYLMTLQ